MWGFATEQFDDLNSIELQERDFEIGVSLPEVCFKLKLKYIV